MVRAAGVTGQRIGAEAESHTQSTGQVVAAALDEVVGGPVLVVGSPPPGGRDLDVVAGPEDLARVEVWLDRAGYRPWRHTWVLFDDDGGYAVELASTDRWRTQVDDASSLFAGAEPLPGMRHLRTPDPATWLLLAARGTVRRRGRVTDKVRRRVARALDDDPGAWQTAAARAEGPGMVGALDLLSQACGAELPLSQRARTAALLGVLTGGGSWQARARVFAAVRPRQLRPVVVAFAGLDGAGKSTQADLLADRQQRLGIAAERRWAGFKTAKQLRARLPVLDRVRGESAPPRPYDRIMPAALQDSRLGRQAWVYAVVVVNLIHLWGAVLRRRPGTSVLVFDRFTPDAAVKLELHFQRTRGIDIRAQRWLFERLTPHPEVAFWVDVPADVALSRRPEEQPERLATMRAIYDQLASRYQLYRLDGTQAPKALARVALDRVWRELP